ncbi:MAG: OadG family protein [Methylococcaceae bacterium]
MAELMSSGLELMFAGMGIVFLFLTMLVAAINTMSSLIQRFFPETPTITLTPPVAPSATDKTTIAAITAAVHHYKSKHK